MLHNCGGVEWWLIRHGLTRWNVEHRYQGHSDVDLLPGEENGLVSLRGELAGMGFAGVYCSDLKRCRQTLQWIRPDLIDQVSYDARLRELNFGAWEGQTYEKLKHDQRYRAWIDDPKRYTPSDGESWEQFHGRVTSFYSELMQVSKELADRSVQPGRTDEFGPGQQRSKNERERRRAVLLIVTHGGVISLLKTLVSPDIGFWDSRVSPGEIVKLQVF
ncbi:histidine phosphatase family protein [Paenibacillus aceti]|uniref:Histidine phosphatase family protein n=1 Tax=Paenibacillus aceti TaxID=1820010 RepID=A0ABQ1VQL3_9BACL|nr:histidine phosphatase family protein [Paenibacillus aceti]GGF85936.1 hypothetical protein GCM10010913_04220 [Paenibacillus aceti]